jgi:Secretory lipase
MEINDVPMEKERLMPNVRLTRARGPFARLALEALGGAAAFAAVLTLAASAAGARNAVPDRGSAVADGRYHNVLISDQVIARLSAADARAELDAARIEPGAPALGGQSARYGITAYRVAYRTIDAGGRPTTASGVVAFPQSDVRQLPMVEYEHGTTADKAEVPSSFGLDAAQDGIEGRWSTDLFASAGFAVAEPDYVGMGRGPGRPQYMVATSEVSASLDLLRAAAQLAGERGGRLDRGVLVTGFSQGGAAAMAVGRALQERAAAPCARLP